MQKHLELDLSSLAGFWRRVRAIAIGLTAALIITTFHAVSLADQVPNPVVTASATPYDGAYLPENMFLPGQNEFATLSQGPCSAPLVTDPNDGTWVELDFGTNVTFDRFILATRNNTVDIVGTNRLYIGNNPVHSTNDTIFTFSAAGDDGSAPIQNTGSASGRYARWEVLSGAVSDNLGGRHMWFLNSPKNMSVLARPQVISATPPYSPTYAADQAEDGKCGNDSAGEEYAINGSVSGATGTQIVFDFGSTNIVISGFDFLNREEDLNTAFTLTFGNDPTFTINIATNSFTANPTNGNAWLTATFPAITARYVQFQSDAAVLVDSTNTPNPGTREMVFYGPAGQKPVIVQDPQSETNYLGDIDSLSVTASGSLPLSYQWFENGAQVIGATNSVLTLTDVTLSDAGSYVVVVSNVYGVATSTPPAVIVVTNPTPNLQSALVLHYTFDETNGTTISDSSSNGYSATLYNYPDSTSMWVPGRIGNALAFNVNGTVDEYATTDLPLIFADTNDFSFAFWAKLASTDNPYNPRIVTPEGDYWVLWTPNQGVGFYPPASSPGPQLGVWTHFVVTYNLSAGQYGLYVNGVKVLNAQSAAYVKPVSDLLNPWVIGHGETISDANDSWKGYLDDLYIFNRALYPSEALALYQLAPLEAPTFTIPPRSQSLSVGQTLDLSPAVDGTAPIAFQWQLNGADIPGAVSEQLIINNAQLINAGTYTLIASNSVSTASATAVINVYQVTNVTSGLGGYWKFDEKSGDTAFDSSGTGDNGTIFNSFNDGGQWTNGLVGGALYFRGPTAGADYVTITDWPPALSGNMTFSTWVMAPALTTTNADIVGGGSGADGTGQFNVSLQNSFVVSDFLSATVGDASHTAFTVTSATPFPTNVWVNVVMVAGSNSLVLYQDGAVVASTPFDGSLLNPTNVMSLGALMSPGDAAPQSGFWTGLMDETAYWTRALSPSEVFELYAAGNAGSPITSASSFSNAAPIVVSSPQGGVVYLGGTFTFQVGATGPSALSYQWTQNGAPISGATNDTFTLASASFSDAGSYAAIVSAATGSATSAPAVLTISAPLPAVDSGLVLYLKLDDAQGSTNALDSSGGGDNGTLVNFPTPVTNWVPGIINGALLFDQGAPNAEAVAVPDEASLDFGTSSFTLALWANGSANQVSSGGLICKGLGGGGESYCVDMYPSTTYRFFVRNSTGEALGNDSFVSGVSPNGTWQDIVVVGDYVAGQASIYINGVLQGTAVLPPDGLLANTSTLDIGARQYQGGYTLPFAGILDDIRVYDRAITPIEVKALYYQGSPPAISISPSTNGTVTVSWPFESITTYSLESSTNLASGNWSAVTGVTTNYVVVNPAGSAVFYRLLRIGNGE